MLIKAYLPNLGVVNELVLPSPSERGPVGEWEVALEKSCYHFQARLNNATLNQVQGAMVRC